jgi:predicted ATP-grasp superfamily ATP-dependent carboligase
MGTISFREATDQLAVPLETIAEVTSRSYPTVLAYRQGQRRPPADVWRALAAFAREHAGVVRETASAIAAVARAAERHERGLR